MIALLSGVVKRVLLKTMIIDCNGVGYELFPAIDLFSEAVEGKSIEAYVHTHVREDQLVLYGFRSIEERDFFRQLISVSGIGPKTALEMLGQPSDQLKQAIVNGDAALIAKTPGIGKKTAERVIVELKNKIDLTPHAASGIGIQIEYSVKEEVVVALEGLGYRKQQVLRFLSDVPEELETSEEIVTYFLKNI